MPKTIKKTLSDENAVRWVDAYCGVFHYTDEIFSPGGGLAGGLIPNPETRGQFANRMFENYAFKDIIKGWEEGVARNEAIEAVPPAPPVIVVDG
jgi:hypothetical protein